MDPTATLLRLIEAVRDRDGDEIRAAADDLAGWIERGGAAPDLRELRRYLVALLD